MIVVDYELLMNGKRERFTLFFFTFQVNSEVSENPKSVEWPFSSRLLFWVSIKIISRLYLYTIQQGGQMVSLNHGKRINNEGPQESINRPSKMMRVDEGRIDPFRGGHASNSMLPHPVQERTHQVYTSFGRLIGWENPSQTPPPMIDYLSLQTHISPDVQSTLLQQVMNLTPEQLRLLTPEQQQEVIKLQQVLKQAWFSIHSIEVVVFYAKKKKLIYLSELRCFARWYLI